MLQCRAMTDDPPPSDDDDDDEGSVADARIADGLAAIWEAYRLDDVPRAVTAGRALVHDHPEHGEGWFWLGCCLERQRDYRAADHAFARAGRAHDEPQPSPFRVSWRHFQHAVESAGDSLPPKLKAALEEVSLVLADYAEPVLLEGFDAPEVMGLFVGPERGDLLEGGGPQLSPRIYLFRRAHEHGCTNRREFDAEVQQTLYHELGHYLGYDEDELDALGRG
jgi:predicted Zn-dependent protease with MMP-like domain